MEKEHDPYLELAHVLVDQYYKHQNSAVLGSINRKSYAEMAITKEKILNDIREELRDYSNEDGTEMTDNQKDTVIRIVKKELWGYAVVDDLIHAPDISDIKIYACNQIRIKKDGKRMDAGVTFLDNSAYQTFVNRILERNKINLGTANAIQTFTDNSQDDFKLRITAISSLLTDNGLPCIAIRKIPKAKYTLEELIQWGAFDEEEIVSRQEKQEKNINNIDSLINSMINSRGIIFTGKGGAGKSTMMNAFLAKVPHDESVMICQENAELFDDEHPDLLAAHVLMNGADTKVSYTLGDLTKAALLVDVDRVIVGEVKEGSEAEGLSKASMTGHKCWTSVHGENCQMAVEKMADYISQATGYAPRDSRKQLCGFEFVVHMNENRRPDEVIRIAGWDDHTDSIIYEEIFPFHKEVS